MTAFVHYYWRLPQSKLTSLQDWLPFLIKSAGQVCWTCLIKICNGFSSQTVISNHVWLCLIKFLIMFDQLSAETLECLIKGFSRTTKQNVDPAVQFVYSRVKTADYLANIRTWHDTLVKVLPITTPSRTERTQKIKITSGFIRTRFTSESPSFATRATTILLCHVPRPGSRGCVSIYCKWLFRKILKILKILRIFRQILVSQTCINLKYVSSFVTIYIEKILSKFKFKSFEKFWWPKRAWQSTIFSCFNISYDVF
jgi:hypothetical protein